MTSSQAGTERVTAGGRRAWGKVAGLSVCLIVTAVYTISAFRLPTPSSSVGIGPDFFPRWIGMFLLILLMIALVGSIVRPGGEAEGDESPIAALVFIVLSIGGVVLFLTIPWFLALSVYMMLTLSCLNRRRHILNAIVAIGVPTALYLIFAMGLDATLPEW